MSTTTPENGHAAEHAFTRRGITELVQTTYGKPPARIDILLDGKCKPCPCSDIHVRTGGVLLFYDQGELIWRFAYCRKCGVAWYATPISREEPERLLPACQATYGEHFGEMVAHEVLVHNKTFKVVAARTIYEEDANGLQASV